MRAVALNGANRQDGGSAALHSFLGLDRRHEWEKRLHRRDSFENFWDSLWSSATLVRPVGPRMRKEE
jgi:hypothetical protein